ncbi:MAG TPA: cell division topological specificity factor MinE [Aquifex sp.]|nr:cell division topological specificity factor MinE [Aquifex sp.]
MGLLSIICKSLAKNNKKLSSAEEAKKRLEMILEYERKKLPTNFPELLKKDLMTLFRKYPQFDTNRIDVVIKRSRDRGLELEQLWISIPFKG